MASRVPTGEAIYPWRLGLRGLVFVPFIGRVQRQENEVSLNEERVEACGAEPSQ